MGKAQIYLFGSRVNDQKKGGDIDLLVLSERLDLSDKLKIKARIFQSLEEQKIDIVIAPPNTPDPFVLMALQDGEKL